MSVLSPAELAIVLDRARSDGRRIVHCHGVFDVVHVGHIRYFEEAKAMGDLLVVTVTPDRHVNKGPHRPAFAEGLRAEVLAALEMVDYVAVNTSATAVEAIKLLRPHVYVKGPDYADKTQDVTGGIYLEEDAVRSVGGQLRFTSGDTYSSSKLVNDHLGLFPPDVTAWLQEFRKQFTAADVKRYIDAFCAMRVLVVGETILDEYVYGETLGKSAKEPILALRFASSEVHGGGAQAVANHLASFVRSVDLVTYLGATNSREDFLRSSLKPNVRPFIVTKEGSPTLVKRRFVDNYSLSKLLEIYEMNDDPLSTAEEEALCDILAERTGTCDVAIVADFGHGLMTARARDLLSERAPYLAVNTQINAANIGFHTISKYSRANYVCVHEGEIRLETRDRSGPLEPLVAQVASRLGCDEVMITRGKQGTLLYRSGEGFSTCPSFAIRVVDRLGAGDAVLSISSLCAARRVPAAVSGFVANVIGAQAVGILGNAASVDRAGVLKSVESLLK